MIESVGTTTLRRSTIHAIAHALSGKAILLCDGEPILDADPVAVDLSQRWRVEFGPAPREWRVTGYAVVGNQGEWKMSGTLDRGPRLVGEGQTFALVLNVRLSAP